MISIILPSYNHSKFLKKRIESILKQTFQDFELIILDDNSIDSSKQIINTYKENEKVSLIIINNINSGSPFKQWEKGIEQAKGELIWIAESDDYCEDTFLMEAYNHLNKEKTDLFYCKSVRIDENDYYIDELNWWYKDISAVRWSHNFKNSALNEVEQYLNKKNVIPNTSAVVFRNKKEIHKYLKEIEEFKYCGDWLFWLQYLKEAKNISYSVNTLNYFRTHSSTTRSFPNKNRNNEILKVYHWLKLNNLLSKNENTLNYFLYNHLIFFSRKNIITNIPIFVKILRVEKNSIWNILKWNLKLK